MSKSVKVTDNLTKKLERQSREVATLLSDAHDEFVKLTPKRSGNARRHTAMKGTVIHANYPYADRLDDGYSKQAPRGMIEPFQQWLKNRLDRILRK